MPDELPPVVTTDELDELLRQTLRVEAERAPGNLTLDGVRRSVVRKRSVRARRRWLTVLAVAAALLIPAGGLGVGAVLQDRTASTEQVPVVSATPQPSPPSPLSLPSRLDLTLSASSMGEGLLANTEREATGPWTGSPVSTVLPGIRLRTGIGFLFVCVGGGAASITTSLPGDVPEVIACGGAEPSNWSWPQITSAEPVIVTVTGDPSIAWRLVVFDPYPHFVRPEASATPAGAEAAGGLILFGTESAATGWGCQTFHTVRPDGSDPRQLAGDCLPQANARWTPDAASIIFDRGPDPTRNVFTASADGTAVHPLSALTDGVIWRPTVSPDGSLIAYERDALDHALGIYVANADGTNERQLTTVTDPTVAYDSAPDFSPDGSEIVFTRFTGPNASEIWIVGVDGSGLRQLTHAAPLVPDGARWSPDGTRVLFSTDHGVTPTDWAVWVIDVDGTNLTRLTPRDGTLNFESDWSPDGTHIVFKHFESGDDFNSVRVMAADGSDVVTILTNPSQQTSETPDWGVSR